jgi:hypothetical protein
MLDVGCWMFNFLPSQDRRENDSGCDRSADSNVRAFLAPDQVRADKAVRAPVSAFLEFALALRRTLAHVSIRMLQPKSAPLLTLAPRHDLCARV